MSNVQKSTIDIVTKDQTGEIVAASSVKAVVSDSKGRKLAEVESLRGANGRYSLDLLSHIASAGQYR